MSSFNTVFPGELASRILTPEIIGLGWSRYGFEWDHSSEAGRLGLHEPFKLEFDPMTVDLHDTRQGFNKTHVKGETLLHQLKATNLKTYFAHSREFLNFQLINADQKYLHLIENAAAAGSAATGSARAAVELEYKIDKDSQSCLYSFETDIYEEELYWMATHFDATEPTGQVSGSAYPLDVATYDRDEFSQSGIRAITWDDLNLGVSGDPTFSIKTVRHPKTDLRNRPVKAHVGFEGEVFVHQNDATMFKAMYTASRKDKPFKVILDDGKTILVDSPSFIPAPVYGDNDQWLRGILRLRVPNTPACVSINTSTNVLSLLRPTVA